MEQAAVMGGGQASADLVRGFESLVAGKAADAAQQGRKVLAIDVLHGEEVLAIDLADVVDAANVGMRNLTGVADFRMESSESGGIFLERGRKKLQRYNIAELEIFCAIDFTHAAATQQSDDPVSFGENCAGRESTAS
jgi:hypothetical protein